jgi:predicted RNA-binding protein with PIN domain
MRFLIDGYNLLFALGRLTPRASKDALMSSRRWLLQQLSAHHTSKSEWTIVFDGRTHVGGKASDKEWGELHVVFSEGESADDVIEERIRTEEVPTQLTVVSNDHRMQRAGRKRGCPVMGCLDFFESVKVPRTEPPPAKSETPGKPTEETVEEREEWLKEFGEVSEEEMWDERYG